jgi:microcompartment protein CcmL/EutN
VEHVLAAQGLVVKHVNAVEVRIVVAAVLAAVADALLVAHHLPKLVANLVTARPVEEVAWRQEALERDKSKRRA